MGDAPAATIERGYRPGAIGRCVEMRVAGFGLPFEAQVASGLAEFSARLSKPVNGLWLALRGERIVGTIAIDGEDLGEGLAHLRWFIVSDRERGRGLGSRLLREAVPFATAKAFRRSISGPFRGSTLRGDSTRRMASS